MACPAMVLFAPGYRRCAGRLDRNHKRPGARSQPLAIRTRRAPRFCLLPLIYTRYLFSYPGPFRSQHAYTGAAGSLHAAVGRLLGQRHSDTCLLRERERIVSLHMEPASVGPGLLSR